MVSTTRAAFQEMIEERGTDAILLPGDLFHSRDLRPKILHQIEQELERIPDEVPVLVSRGNHDENLTPRDVTWLNYLHQRGHIVFLQAELNADPETAWLNPYDPEEPGQSAGFYDIDAADVDGPVRVFGLQWRGAKTDQALQQVAKGIKETNEMHGEPAWTVLLAQVVPLKSRRLRRKRITHAVRSASGRSWLKTRAGRMRRIPSTCARSILRSSTMLFRASSCSQ